MDFSTTTNYYSTSFVLSSTSLINTTITFCKTFTIKHLTQIVVEIGRNVDQSPLLLVQPKWQLVNAHLVITIDHNLYDFSARRIHTNQQALSYSLRHSTSNLLLRKMMCKLLP